jgi:hypothetical protein
VLSSVAADQAYFSLWIRNADAAPVQFLDQRHMKFAGNGAVVGRRDPGLDGDLDVRLSEPYHLNHGRRIIQHPRIGANQLANDAERGPKIRLIGNANSDVRLAYSAVIVQDFADDLAIGHDDS